MLVCKNPNWSVTYKNKNIWLNLNTSAVATKPIPLALPELHRLWKRSTEQNPQWQLKELESVTLDSFRCEECPLDGHCTAVPKTYGCDCEDCLAARVSGSLKCPHSAQFMKIPTRHRQPDEPLCCPELIWAELPDWLELNGWVDIDNPEHTLLLKTLSQFSHPIELDPRFAGAELT